MRIISDLRRDTATSRVLYVLFLMVFVTIVSFAVWMKEGLRLDEAQSIWQTSRDIGGVIEVIARDVHAPLYFVLLHYWTVVFGVGEVAVRSLSLIFYLLSIPAMFFLGLVSYGRRSAYFASLLVAISPFLNWYGSEARMYSLLLFLTIMSHFFFMLLWKRPSREAWIGYTITTFLGIFTHFFFYFILAAQAMSYVFRRDLFPAGVFKHFVKVVMVVVGSGLAWFAYRWIAGSGAASPFLPRPSTVDLANIFSNFFIGFQADAVNTFYLSLWPVLVLVGFTFLARRKWADPETKYFVLSTFVPIILAFIVSITLRPIFLSRYLIICLPSLYLIIAHFVFSYRRTVSNSLMVGVAVTMAVMLFAQASDLNSPVKEDYRTAAIYISETAKPYDVVVLSAPFITYPVEYYYTGHARLVTFPRWDRFIGPTAPIPPFSIDDLATQSEEWRSVYQHAYVLLGYDQGYQEDVRLYMDQNFERIDVKTFSPGLALYVYRLRYIQ